MKKETKPTDTEAKKPSGKADAPTVQTEGKTGAPEEKVSIVVTSPTTIKIGCMECAVGAEAEVSPATAEKMIADGVAKYPTPQY